MKTKQTHEARREQIFRRDPRFYTEMTRTRGENKGER